MHLAVHAGERAVGVDRHRGVVIEPRRAPLEQRCDHDHMLLARYRSQPLRARARDRLGQVEQRGVLALAEILRAEELRQADDLRAGARRLADAVCGLVQIGVRVWRAGHLHQADAVFHSSGHVVLTILDSS